MKIPVTLVPHDMMAVLQKLDSDGTTWDFRGSSDGTLHLYIDGEMSPHRIKLENYGSWSAHSEMELAA